MVVRIFAVLGHVIYPSFAAVEIPFAWAVEQSERVLYVSRREDTAHHVHTAPIICYDAQWRGQRDFSTLSGRNWNAEGHPATIISSDKFRISIFRKVIGKPGIPLELDNLPYTRKLSLPVSYDFRIFQILSRRHVAVYNPISNFAGISRIDVSCSRRIGFRPSGPGEQLAVSPQVSTTHILG